MIRTGICDDDAAARAYLTALANAQEYPCETVLYASAAECLADSRTPDLLFLDIELGGGADGMALARELRARCGGARPVIVFVTGYEQYVFDAFDVGAFHYLLKPVDEEKFRRVFARAAEQFLAGQASAPPARVLTFRCAGANRTVPVDAIAYIESCDHKVIVHARDGEFACYAKIRDLEAELHDPFFRIHKGYLVNLAFVAGYSKTEVMLTDGTRLLLSKYKYQAFVRAYLHFLKQGDAEEPPNRIQLP